MKQKSNLEDNLFLSLQGARNPEYFELTEYAKIIHEGMRKGGEERNIFYLLEYSDYFTGNYILKNSNEGLELEKMCLGEKIAGNGRGAIHARVVFPENYCDLVKDLKGDLFSKQIRINIYPRIEEPNLENIDLIPKWKDSEGINARILYRKGGLFRWGKIFSLDKMFLQGIEIDGEGKISQSRY